MSASLAFLYVGIIGISISWYFSYFYIGIIGISIFEHHWHFYMYASLAFLYVGIIGISIFRHHWHFYIGIIGISISASLAFYMLVGISIYWNSVLTSILLPTILAVD